MNEDVKLVGCGIDTLVVNLRYTDGDFVPQHRELDEGLQAELDRLQAAAKATEDKVESPWLFLGRVPLFVEPHGGGKQWRWLLTCPLLKIVVARGRFNDIIAQVRFASEFLWSQVDGGYALYLVHDFLMALFGEYVHLQVSEVHLCADETGYAFAECDYARGFVARVRKSEVIYGPDGLALDCYRDAMQREMKQPASRHIATLAFSRHRAPISAVIYNKTREIEQAGQPKTWFHDLWKGNGWDGTSEVWRVECRFKREFLHEVGIEDAYDILGNEKRLWDYAVGHEVGGEDGLPNGWLRYVLPDEDDTNRSRWPLHPVWKVIQSAFVEDAPPGLGPLVRRRIAEKNIERGIAATVGYLSTLAAWLGGDKATPEADISTMLHWLAEQGPEYLEAKDRDFAKEVQKKQRRLVVAAEESEVA
jgi:hypothetical protein